MQFLYPFFWYRQQLIEVIPPILTCFCEIYDASLWDANTGTVIIFTSTCALYDNGTITTINFHSLQDVIHQNEMKLSH